MRPEAGYHFVCPACGESADVNEPMKDTLLERGCITCGASLHEDAFESL